MTAVCWRERPCHGGDGRSAAAAQVVGYRSAKTVLNMFEQVVKHHHDVGSSLEEKAPWRAAGSRLPRSGLQELCGQPSLLKFVSHEGLRGS